MNSTAVLAKHLREVHFGKNWTWVNLKDTLSDVTWEEATTKVYSFNTILALTYHIHFYIHAVLEVLNGGPLSAHDKYAFDHPPVNSKEDWDNLLEKTWTEAEQFASLIEQLPDNKLPEIFVEEKYGTYYRNFLGIIEHTHYHMGQMVIIKKLIRETH